MGQLQEAEEERLAYLRQNARGVLSDPELDRMLSEADERRRAIAAELQRAQDAANLEREREAVRETLAGAAGYNPAYAEYNPVHAEWYEDPDAVLPSQYLSLAAAPEETRRAYLKTGARFTVDRYGTLTLELNPLQSDRTPTETSCGSSTRRGTCEGATPP